MMARADKRLDSIHSIDSHSSQHNSLSKAEVPSKPIKIPQVFTLFLVLLPRNGNKHTSIVSKCVKIKSENINACFLSDFLQLCKQIFDSKETTLNYIYDQDGVNIESM